MAGTILDPIKLNGQLSNTETMTGKLGERKESRPIEDSNGYLLADSSNNIMMDYHTANPMSGNLSDTSAMSGNISSTEDIHVALSDTDRITASITIPTSRGGTPYSGDYVVTPTTETQVLNTQGKSMRSNVTINPIPSNYGLITWNGAILTVS